MKRKVMMVFAAMLTAAAFAVMPQEARADETREEAGRCAVRYLQVNHSTNASRIIAGYDTIDLRDRAWQLIRVHELAPAISTGSSTFAEDLNNFVRGQASSLQLGRMRDIMLLPELPLQADIDSGDTDLQESAVSRLADCDRTFGFAPVIALAPVLSDFDCAVAYWLLGAFNSAQQGMALHRARFAIARHLEANPGTQRQQVEQQVMVDGQARGQRIQQGQESSDLMQATLARCEMKYGFAQAGGQ